MTVRLHVETDLGGDPDDACALVMLLGLPDVEVTGITTVADPDGRRAGYALLLLGTLDRTDIPLAAGAAVSATTGKAMGAIPDHAVFWGEVPEPRPRRVTSGDALDLLAASIASGAVVAVIGPATNLARLESERPGRLADASVVMMGGWFGEMPEGAPDWGPGRDWNVACDVLAAQIVFRAAGALTCSTIPGTVSAQLRERDLPRLRASGAVGKLLARQSLAHGKESRLRELAVGHPLVAPDIVNFHWDPVACAVATGVAPATVEAVRVRAESANAALRLVPDSAGRECRVVTAVNPEAFSDLWLSAVEHAQRSPGSGPGPGS